MYYFNSYYICLNKMDSETVKEQKEVLEELHKMKGMVIPQLMKEQHVIYMLQNLNCMGKSIIYFDYGQPWIYYYILNAITIAGQEVPGQWKQKIIQGLKYCWNEQLGGFGGGYKQLPHLAPTYAAFLSILIIGADAYHLLDKEGLTKFFRACKKGKQYQIAIGAELDLRACYIVAIIVKLLKLDESLLDGVV